MLEPPRPGQAARFANGFAPRSLLTVDTEEEFDWDGPFQAEGHTLHHVARLRRFQEFCENLDVSPVYLVDWPIVQDPQGVEIIGDAVRRGVAEVGIQLHPWVSPPHEEEVNTFNSFAGNLPEPLERAKFMKLRDAIEEKFGVAPQIYRAGRYGLGPNSAQILKDAGVSIDSSVRAKFDYSAGHGPDYSSHPLMPYWVDPEQALLELPLTTVYWGMLRKQGDLLYPALRKLPHGTGLLSRLGMLERISLTPEGVEAEEALRAIDIALDDGLPLLVLSFHSPSLMPGNTPYVRSEEDLEKLYNWWRTIYGYLDRRKVKPTTVKEIIASAERVGQHG